MFNISNFLEKFLRLDKNNNLRRITVLEVIKKEIGIELKKEDIEIKGEQIKIKANPVIRNEIFMHREQIEDSLKSQKIFLNII